MRTNVPSIYAVGDVAGRYLFTHSAGYEAVRAMRDMFFPGKGKVPASSRGARSPIPSSPTPG